MKNLSDTNFIRNSKSKFERNFRKQNQTFIQPIFKKKEKSSKNLNYPIHIHVKNLMNHSTFSSNISNQQENIPSQNLNKESMFLKPRAISQNKITCKININSNLIPLKSKNKSNNKLNLNKTSSKIHGTDLKGNYQELSRFDLHSFLQSNQILNSNSFNNHDNHFQVNSCSKIGISKESEMLAKTLEFEAKDREIRLKVK